jgi:hypothetical protein
VARDFAGDGFAWSGDGPAIDTDAASSHALWLRRDSIGIHSAFQLDTAGGGIEVISIFAAAWNVIKVGGSPSAVPNPGLGVWYGLVIVDDPVGNAITGYTLTGSGSTDSPQSGLTTSSLGLGSRINGSFGLDGALAYSASWTGKLNAAERAALLAGVSPLSIRPSSLVSYIPMLTASGAVLDWITGGVSDVPSPDAAWVDTPHAPPMSRPFPTPIPEPPLPSIGPGVLADHQRVTVLASDRRDTVDADHQRNTVLSRDQRRT